MARPDVFRPDLALSTDIIVGFPGETEDDFQETLRAVETVQFAQAYSFKYSPRPGTPAAERASQVEEEVKADRLSRLQSLLRAQQAAFNESTVGRSPYLQAVHADGELALLGRITPTEIVGSSQNSLRGVIKNRDSFATY